ncbi:DNA pilot protein [Peromfec virus RodF8_22]|uniref:DNA pilot protein n=1 Tax=Peromfec virus RodF8_22 TaxID=2929364 RepID=A0A976N263_9VIRU|nr:DNA pilot protein [Peromfec virus RodF8_22]
MATLNDLSGLVALTSAATSNERVKKQIGYQKDAQLELMQAQNLINVGNYDYQLEREAETKARDWELYNSPAAQREALEAAGYNADAFAGTSGASGGSGSASIGGTSIPSAPNVEYDPLGDALKAAQTVQEIGRARLEMDELERSTRYNVDAQGLKLRQLAAQTRASEAEATLTEKQAGVFDDRETRARRSQDDAHFRHLADLDQMALSDFRDSVRLVREGEQQKLQRKKIESDIASNDASTRKTETDLDYLNSHGYYPGTKFDYKQSLGNILFGSDEDLSDTERRARRWASDNFGTTPSPGRNGFSSRVAFTVLKNMLHRSRK